MSTDETDHQSGIPTRGIHEAYLDMQRALKEYRRVKDHTNQTVRTRAHGDLQDAVLTCYEMIRPYLRKYSQVEDYWHGSPPPYTHDSTAPEPREGNGILAHQTHRDIVQLNGHDTEGLETLREWHDALNMGENNRLEGVQQTDDDTAFVSYQVYELGLKRLDDWETTVTTQTKNVGGFLGNKTKTEQVQQHVAPHKLKNAAREIASVLDELGLLAQIDETTTRTEITREDIKKVEQWHKQQTQ